MTLEPVRIMGTGVVVISYVEKVNHNSPSCATVKSLGWKSCEIIIVGQETASVVLLLIRRY